MFRVPPETGGGPDVDPELSVGVTVPLHALTAKPTVQRVATAVIRLVLRDIAYSFGHCYRNGMKHQIGDCIFSAAVVCVRAM
jgi:hypothetical protein